MKKINLTKDYYSTSETAEICAYSDSSTIRQMIERGSVKAKKIGERWVVEKNEVERLFQERLKFYNKLKKIVDVS